MKKLVKYESVFSKSSVKKEKVNDIYVGYYKEKDFNIFVEEGRQFLIVTIRDDSDTLLDKMKVDTSEGVDGVLYDNNIKAEKVDWGRKYGVGLFSEVVIPMEDY